nr:hypothetical protein [Tanacetum cinerariifolium]
MMNKESARDVYSKRRIITVTELQIVKWHDYKHLDWITVRRDDDKLYKFKEGGFKRLRIQDIKHMLLLLVQGKLTNLTVEERFAFNNKDKQNMLMRIDELHKFSDGTLNDVQTALDDCLKGIRMKYLPQTIWRRSDKERAAAMIQTIDKQLKTRRIMRSMEKFVEEEPQEEEDDIEVDIEEDKNEPKLTYPNEEDETVLASVHEVDVSSTALFLREDNDGLFSGLMRKMKRKGRVLYKLILDLGNELCFSMEQGMVAIEKLVKKLGNVEEKAECKKLKKELEEERIMPSKSAPLTQAAIRQMIKESIDAAITAKRARHVNTGNDARGGKSNQKENSRQTLQNNLKQGNAQAMISAVTDGKVSSRSLPLCEHYFTHHIGLCTIKCHKCGKVGHKGRNRCPRKIKQVKAGEVGGRAYAIKDAEP